MHGFIHRYQSRIMIQRKDKKGIPLKNYLLTYMLLTLLLATATFAALWLVHENRELKIGIKRLNERSLKEDKKFVLNETKRIARNIQFIRKMLHNLPEDSVKEKILDEIASWRTDYSGYPFVNTLEGQALIFDGHRVEGYKDIRNLTDPNGLRLFDIEKQAQNMPEGLYMQYLFKKMDSNEPESKVSYIMCLPDWHWLVGVGIYRSDSQEEINVVKAQYIADYKRDLLLIFIIFIGVGLISYLFVLRINRRISSEVNQLAVYFDHAAHNDTPVKIENLKFQQFNRIANELNGMLKKRVLLKKKLAEREHRIQGIFNAADNIGFIFTNLDEKEIKILDFSPGAENLFDYQREEMENKPINVLLNEKGKERMRYISDYISRGKTKFHDELDFARKDGSQFTAIISVHPLTKNSKIVGTILVLVDITKRKEAELELLNYQANLEELVDKRTHEIEEKNSELMEKNAELEHFNDLFVGREFRIKELRDRVKSLEKEVKRG